MSLKRRGAGVELVDMDGEGTEDEQVGVEDEQIGVTRMFVDGLEQGASRKFTHSERSKTSSILHVVLSSHSLESITVTFTSISCGVGETHWLINPPDKRGLVSFRGVEVSCRMLISVKSERNGSSKRLVIEFIGIHSRDTGDMDSIELVTEGEPEKELSEGELEPDSGEETSYSGTNPVEGLPSSDPDKSEGA